MSRNQPDTRVRLTAEGVEEVVNAFKRIAAEGKKAGKVGAEGFDLMAAAGSRLAAVLPTITFAAVIAGAAAMTKQAIDTADAMGKLSQKTGLTAETLSVFAFAAKTADVEQGELEAGLRLFQRTMGDYTQGAQSARDATEQLFGSRNALNNLNDDERLLKVVDALGKLDAGARKTKLAMDFFGRSGAELIPLLDDLANGGFEELRRKAEGLGLIIDSKTAAAAQRANDGLTRMQTVAEGVANQFASGLTPALAESAEVLLDSFGMDGIDVFKTLGEFSGEVIKGIVRRTVNAAIVLSQWFLDIKGIAANAGQLIDDVLAGNVRGSIDRFDARARQNEAAIQLMVAVQTAALEASFVEAEQKSLAAAKKHARVEPQDLINLDGVKKAADARLKLEESLLDQELALTNARLKLRNENEKVAFSEGLRGVEQHFAKRRKLAEEEADAEIAAFRKREELIKATTAADASAQAEKDKNLSEIRTKIQLREIELQGDLIKLRAEERKAAEDVAKQAAAAEEQRARDIAESIAAEDKAIADQAAAALEAFLRRRQFERELLELQGNRHEAALRAIDDETNERAAQLNKDGLKSQEIVETVERFRQAKLKELSEQEAAAIQDIERRRLEAQGKRHEAALLSIEAEAREIDRSLKAAGVGDEVRARKVSEFVTAQKAILEFERVKERADAALREIERSREEIQAQVRSGLIFQVQANQQILAMERERLPQLSEIADGLTAAAEATGDPHVIEQTEDFTAAVRDLHIETNTAALRMAELRDAFEGSATDALTTFFSSGIDGSQSLADAFRGMAASIISSLRQVAAQMIATLIIQRTLGAAFGGFGIGTTKPPPVNVASGGFIRGPGTGTSDSIPANLSNGEFVVNARATRLHRHWLEAINGMATPAIRSGRTHFAEGGLVEASPAGSIDGTVVVGLEEGLILKALDTPAGSRLVVKLLGKQKKSARAVIG